MQGIKGKCCNQFTNVDETMLVRRARRNDLNKILLHLEGLFVFALCLYLYSILEFNWILFIILLFIPDIFMIGYFINNRVGAILYNIVHTYSVPIILTMIGILTSSHVILCIGIIWTAHIGMDRLFGFGLKYPTNFKDNHLNRI